MPRSISVKSRCKQAQTEQILKILRKWGIRTLGQFAALDKEDLNERLGPEAVRLWERANGKSTRLLKLVQPPESFGESFEFEHDVETVEPLLFMLRRFLQQLALRLSAIYLVAKELTLRITFADPPSDGFAVANKKGASAARTYERCFKIPQPTNDVDLLFRMLHTHLENFKSAQPIVAVSLEAQPIKPARQQFGLFETALRDPNQLYETLARLTALLGTERVGTPVLEETYRPDAFHLEPFTWQVGAIEACPPWRMSSHYSSDATHSAGSGQAQRIPPISKPALRRFRPSAAASVFLSENIPTHFQSEKVSGKILDQRGPYFRSGNWWDEKTWARREWDLQLDDGVLLCCHQSGETWEIDGVYD